MRLCGLLLQYRAAWGGLSRLFNGKRSLALHLFTITPYNAETAHLDAAFCSLASTLDMGLIRIPCPSCGAKFRLRAKELPCPLPSFSVQEL